MKLHWSLSNLIVLTITVAMLGMTQFALAVHEPFPCFTCCTAQNNYCQDNEQYRSAVRTNYGITTIYTTGKIPSQTQLNTIATAINNAVAENYQSWVETATEWIDKNAKLIEEPTVNVSQLYAAMKGVGYLPNNEAQILAWAKGTTLAQRISSSNTFKAEGLFGLGAYINNTAALLKAIPRLPRDINGKFILNPDGTCQAVAMAAATSALYGGILAFIPGGQGAALIAGLIGLMLVFISQQQAAKKETDMEYTMKMNNKLRFALVTVLGISALTMPYLAGHAHQIFPWIAFAACMAAITRLMWFKTP